MQESNKIITFTQNIKVMKKGKISISNDFKNSTKRKVFEAEVFIAKYNNGEYYRIFIDREDERRQIITLDKERFKEFKEMILKAE